MKRMMLLGVLICIAGCFPAQSMNVRSPAYGLIGTGERWELVSSYGGVETYIDKGSIEKELTLYKVWLMYVYTSDHQLEYMRGAYSISKLWIQINEKRWWKEFSTVYSARGGHGKKSINTIQQWEPIAGDSDLEKVYEYLSKK
jgi:hypothetical protein